MKQTKIKKIIKFRQELFWDVDPKTIDPKKHARYIIERIVDFGNDKEAKWLYYFYPHSLINKTVTRSRSILPQSKALWQAIT